MTDEQKKTGIIVPKEKLSEQVLTALIDEFVLREGTDYGRSEYTLEQKREHISRQLQAHKILILFDPTQENTTLLTIEQIKQLNRQNFDIVGLPEGL